jgi:hypothetical protein
MSPEETTAGQTYPASAGSVFEIVDASSDETYWTCGIFLTLESAVAAINECDEPHDLGGDHSDFDDDYAKVEVRERKVGWSGTGKVVHTQEWERKYDEPTDDYSWTKKPNAGIERPKKQQEGRLT